LNKHSGLRYGKCSEENMTEKPGQSVPILAVESRQLSSKQKERTNNVYSRLAGVYSFFRIKDGLNTLLDLMEIENGNNILDIGTGPGLYALHIAKNWPSCTVHGLDPCERFLEIARKKAAKQDTGNLHFAVGDAEQMHFGDEVFERVLVSSALVLIPDKKRAISETYRVLKPGGIAVFKELLHKWFIRKEVFYVFWKLYIKTLGLYHKEIRGVKRSDYEGTKFTEDDMRKLLEESPFTNYSVLTKGTRLYAVCRK
jgi:demethylmenaquinone methyltransferase/2-methoxy-6-polyprenyl-1,4-benzoquinol methylase